ncbi:Hypothetical predicted protein [Olea europaea subsp. europaea]|uniref:Uncharacterized protein n=1 Tax=Olea europaea subsp. europaea TaxID=158383 RepID=A0A8S0TAH7_OLEEU|nr:Hypothetical predicted protein [Olea europaea subsp. europaea]
MTSAGGCACVEDFIGEEEFVNAGDGVEQELGESDGIGARGKTSEGEGAGDGDCDGFSGDRTSSGERMSTSGCGDGLREFMVDL